MKRIILSYIFLFSILLFSYAQDSTAVKSELLASDNEAIQAYNERDFRKTIELLENEKSIQKEKGLESAGLYYNLGNAHFRVNELAKARLYYERALLLEPGDRDTRHNIEYLSTKIEDKILVADTFFLYTWFQAVQNLYGSNRWATVGVSFFLVLMACLFLFFFSRSILAKKSAFYVGIVSIVIVTFANIFSYNQKKKIEYRDTAVVMAGSVPVVSSPDINSKELFILHSGTKVSVTKEDRNWLEIEIDNGSVGWIQRDKLEII